MIGYYAAYAVLAIAMLFILWLHDRATVFMAGLVTSFLLVALAIPSLALWLRQRGSRPLPPRLEHIGVVRSLLETVAQAPSALLRDRPLLCMVALYNGLIFLADAASLFACLLALDQPVGFGTAFIALIMASIVVTLGPVPLGLGSFEATSTTTLHLLGVPVEAAFAATMLLRILTLWLPLLPGVVLLQWTQTKTRNHRSEMTASSSETDRPG
ncbi:lysylphosphatidylglycerol synthase transmembrane domain-containing protein [Sphingobium fuliginis]|nr:lysylphosphatidylglycerol synthase transmembrane domain-containing protein [Sphingobium fuliginis]